MDTDFVLNIIFSETCEEPLVLESFWARDEERIPTFLEDVGNTKLRRRALCIALLLAAYQEEANVSSSDLIEFRDEFTEGSWICTLCDTKDSEAIEKWVNEKLHIQSKIPLLHICTGTMRGERGDTHHKIEFRRFVLPPENMQFFIKSMTDEKTALKPVARNNLLDLALKIEKVYWRQADEPSSIDQLIKLNVLRKKTNQYSLKYYDSEKGAILKRSLQTIEKMIPFSIESSMDEDVYRSYEEDKPPTATIIKRILKRASEHVDLEMEYYRSLAEPFFRFVTERTSFKPSTINNFEMNYLQAEMFRNNIFTYNAYVTEQSQVFLESIFKNCEPDEIWKNCITAENEITIDLLSTLNFFSHRYKLYKYDGTQDASDRYVLWELPLFQHLFYKLENPHFKNRHVGAFFAQRVIISDFLTNVCLPLIRATNHHEEECFLRFQRNCEKFKIQVEFAWFLAHKAMNWNTALEVLDGIHTILMGQAEIWTKLLERLKLFDELPPHLKDEGWRLDLF